MTAAELFNFPQRTENGAGYKKLDGLPKKVGKVSRNVAPSFFSHQIKRRQ